MAERPVPPEVAQFIEEVEALLAQFGKIEEFYIRARGQPYPSRAEEGLSSRYDVAREHAFALLAGVTDQASEFRRPGLADSYGRGRSMAEKARRAVSRLGAIRLDAMTYPERWQAKLALRTERNAGRGAQAPTANRIFLGHGRSLLFREVEAHLARDCGLDVVAYETEPRTGEHIVETLEKLLDECGFAVIVATAEDATGEGATRARQNVVHEIGLFQGKRGFRRVAILLEKGTESFSNIAGLQYIPFSGNDIQSAFYELDRTLEREGFLRPRPPAEES